MRVASCETGLAMASLLNQGILAIADMGGKAELFHATQCRYVPSLAAKSSKLLAAISTAALGLASPVPGPRSSGRATCAVRSPHLAAASKSLVWAATIMQSLGGRSNASQAAR